MRGLGIFRALYLPIVNLLYPANCHVCGSALSPFYDFPVCPDCLRKIRFIGRNACAVCGCPLPETAPTGEGFLCGECRMRSHYFRRAISGFVYDGPARELIHVFKYSGRRYLARFFAGAIGDAVEARAEVTGKELIVPVPIHRSRLRERGYNQAGEIARSLGKILGLEVESRALERTSQSSSQVGMTRRQRRENVRGCFRVVDRRFVRGVEIYLVDDVYTTGATLDECSRVLLRAGAESVTALTAARDMVR